MPCYLSSSHFLSFVPLHNDVGNVATETEKQATHSEGNYCIDKQFFSFCLCSLLKCFSAISAFCCHVSVLIYIHVYNSVAVYRKQLHLFTQMQIHCLCNTNAGRMRSEVEWDSFLFDARYMRLFSLRRAAAPPLHPFVILYLNVVHISGIPFK